MLQRQGRDQLEFFVCGSLRDLVPDEHVLARVDPVLDLSWLHEELAEVYASGVGRPAIDPESAVRLMLAGFLLGIVHDRRLMRGEGRPATGSRGAPEPGQSGDPLVRRLRPE